MPYANHRIVGVIELNSVSNFAASNLKQGTTTRPANNASAAKRRISSELTDSRSTTRIAFEPSIKVDAATLQRELESELGQFLSVRLAVALS